MAAPDQAQLELDSMSVTTQVEIKRIAEWAGTSATGDQAELPDLLVRALEALGAVMV